MQITSVELTKKLIEFPSTTPDTTGALDYLSRILSEAGFKVEFLEYNGVRNLFAKFGNSTHSTLLLGHTDVVPTGDLSLWTGNPFKPVMKDGYLFGRGAADMKAGVSALVCAAIQHTTSNPKSSISILLTADEEGVAEHGVKSAIIDLDKGGHKFDYCLVAEPSSSKSLGDTIRVGRRGSLNAKISVKGKQGHVAFAENAVNPIHQVIEPLSKILSANLSVSDNSFPPTSFQITNISSGTGADNVIPDALELMCNFRFGTGHSVEQLRSLVEEALKSLDCEIVWRHSASPFLSTRGKLIETVCAVVKDELGYAPELSTGGGTSDARFIAPYGAEIVELGVINSTSHQIDECVLVDDISKLTNIFIRVLDLIYPA